MAIENRLCISTTKIIKDWKLEEKKSEVFAQVVIFQIPLDLIYFWLIFKNNLKLFCLSYFVKSILNVMLVIFFKMNHTDMTDNHIAKMIYFRMVVVERERGGEQKIERVIDRERETKKK